MLVNGWIDTHAHFYPPVNDSERTAQLRRTTIMQYRKLGSSDLEVSEISLGSWLPFAGGVSAEQTRACTELGLVR